jgi:hypothetical protein
MKKRTWCAFALLALLAATIVAPARADAGVSLGLSSWYAWWDTRPDYGYETDPEPLFGPVLGVDFAERWSLTSVLLVGTYHAKNDIDPEYTYRRYDSDSALNYSLNRYFKVFAGFKYMRYDTSSDQLDRDVKQISYGPGIGVGFTLPLSDSLFAIANVSAMYLFGLQRDPWADWVEVGYNTALGLAYYITPIATTITAGVRYQNFETRAADGDTKHKFYGMTLAAVWHFSTGTSDVE